MLLYSLRKSELEERGSNLFIYSFQNRPEEAIPNIVVMGWKHGCLVALAKQPWQRLLSPLIPCWTATFCAWSPCCSESNSYLYLPPCTYMCWTACRQEWQHSPTTDTQPLNSCSSCLSCVSCLAGLFLWKSSIHNCGDWLCGTCSFCVRSM